MPTVVLRALGLERAAQNDKMSLTARNGLKETETQRKYAKAYETSYMTEQLAKLVVCVASQTEMMRARTGGNHRK